MAEDANTRREYEEDQKDIFYINNIFMKLNDIHLKRKQGYHEYDANENVILCAAITLLGYTREIPSVEHILYSDYHFVITLPMHWDHEIREELMHPLFLKPGSLLQMTTTADYYFSPNLTQVFDIFSIMAIMNIEK